MPYFTSHDGASLYYEEVGNGQPVLFLHGWALNHSIWKYECTLLAKKGFRIIMPDLRGHSRSEKGRSFTLADFVADVDALVNHLQLKKPIIGAHSLGCLIALHYALRHPVKKLVLASPVFPESMNWFGRFRMWIVRVLLHIFFFKRKKLSLDFSVKPQAKLKRLWQVLHNPADVELATLHFLFAQPLVPLLRRVKVPTLVFQGTHDMFATKRLVWNHHVDWILLQGDAHMVFFYDTSIVYYVLNFITS